LDLGVIDEIIPEPPGGAHSNYTTAAKNLKTAITQKIEELITIPIDKLLELRIEKYRRMGVFKEV
jgi:acetyl-CoA carboxylase carboxyl transferase subunit alpha